MNLARFIKDCDYVQVELDRVLDNCRYLVRCMAARDLQPKIHWFCHKYKLKFDAGIGRFINGDKIVDPDYQTGYPLGARDDFHEALLVLDHLIYQEVFEGEELHNFLQDYDGTPSADPIPEELAELFEWAEKHGKVVKYGPHVYGVGFFASCTYPGSSTAWADSGHGHTLAEAAQHALDLYQGKAVRFKSSSEFEID